MSVTCRILIIGVMATSASYLTEASRSDGNRGGNYQFQYRVKDELTGQDFGQEESRNDYHTAGEYEVMLPDGRRQIVTYTVLDATSGYVANVAYEGVPHYDPVPSRPKYTPVRPAPAPARAPAPVRAHAPVRAPAPAAPIYRQQALAAIRKPAPGRQAKSSSFRRPAVGPRFQASGSNRHQSTLQRPIRVNVGSLSSSSLRSESGRKMILRKSKKIVVTTPAPVEATPAVYIPSRYPKTAQYKDILHPSETKILYSLFREDINEIMKPPKKIPASKKANGHDSRRRRY